MCCVGPRAATVQWSVAGQYLEVILTTNNQCATSASSCSQQPTSMHSLEQWACVADLPPGSCEIKPQSLQSAGHGRHQTYFHRPVQSAGEGGPTSHEGGPLPGAPGGVGGPAGDLETKGHQLDSNVAAEQYMRLLSTTDNPNAAIPRLMDGGMVRHSIVKQLVDRLGCSSYASVLSSSLCSDRW
jgi:hypothetical protein